MKVGDRIKNLRGDYIHEVGTEGVIVSIQAYPWDSSKKYWVHFNGDPEDETAYFYENEIEKLPDINPDTTIPDGDLEGWEIMLKVVTNGLGQSAIVLQSNVVYEGPTDDMQQIVDRIAEFMLED